MLWIRPKENNNVVSICCAQFHSVVGEAVEQSKTGQLLQRTSQILESFQFNVKCLTRKLVKPPEADKAKKNEVRFLCGGIIGFGLSEVSADYDHVLPVEAPHLLTRHDKEVR